MFSLLSAINRYLTRGFIKEIKNERINIVVDYSYNEANDFDFTIPVSINDKEFWTGIGYKMSDKEYILHTKTNLLFDKNGNILGRIFNESNDCSKILSYIPIDQLSNNEQIIQWLEECGYISKDSVNIDIK
jgi:hypothetical protein